MEKKNYIDYIVEETKKILAIDSPSGYTKEVAEYVLGEYRALGHKAMTVCMVIANRLIKEANTGYKNTIDHLILKVLERI